jgi:hypothetical protein
MIIKTYQGGTYEPTRFEVHTFTNNYGFGGSFDLWFGLDYICIPIENVMSIELI